MTASLLDVLLSWKLPYQTRGGHAFVSLRAMSHMANLNGIILDSTDDIETIMMFIGRVTYMASIIFGFLYTLDPQKVATEDVHVEYSLVKDTR
eukprot:4159136-Pleurochrysis_carterae.AAC.1